MIVYSLGQQAKTIIPSFQESGRRRRRALPHSADMQRMNPDAGSGGVLQSRPFAVSCSRKPWVSPYSTPLILGIVDCDWLLGPSDAPSGVISHLERSIRMATVVRIFFFWVHSEASLPRTLQQDRYGKLGRSSCQKLPVQGGAGFPH